MPSPAMIQTAIRAAYDALWNDQDGDGARNYIGPLAEVQRRTTLDGHFDLEQVVRAVLAAADAVRVPQHA